MQDEVTKHTKKIYKTVKDKEHSFAEKVKEIIVEICIIVFAVTLSIWLHSWSEQRHERHEAVEFLKGLKKDLNADINTIGENKKTILLLDSNYAFLQKIEVGKVQKDDSINHRLRFNLIVTRPNIGRYEGFKSSGKIGTIENDALKQTILEYYQQTIPDINYGENYVNNNQNHIIDLRIDKPDNISLSNFIASTKMKTLLQLNKYNFEVNIYHYDNAIKQAKKIIAEIDEDVKE